MNATTRNGSATKHGPSMFPPDAASMRFVGIDVGAETIKLAELRRDADSLRVERTEILEHGKNPGRILREALQRWDWDNVGGAAASGRFSPQINLRRIPAKQAQLRGCQFLFGDAPATIVNIGSHGFTVLEVRGKDLSVFRENSRCSQGTGNFLRQLVERFSLTVEEASALCADVPNPAPLSGRCPVILKTDMTHLANKGEDRVRILAGLFDAVCENVMVLVKPGVSPACVLLTGGVSRSPRVRRVFGELLAKQNMSLIAADEKQALCLEALGCALIAAEGTTDFSKGQPNRREVLERGSLLPLLERKRAIEKRQRAAAVQDAGATATATDNFKSSDLPALENLLLPPRELKLERLPSLGNALDKVRRMPAQPWAAVNGEFRRLVLGFDIGSTGSKLVAMDVATRETVWDGYGQTLGNPVGAAQDLLRRFTGSPAAKYPVVAFGATGSGREITGSLLTSCYGKDAVFIVNEIVAHATGALHYDSRVDTIFEIGGQDAKYIRLAEGRIIDCAMNEACSAGTGSFIEEQGRKFTGIGDVRQLGQAAMAAPCGVSLGQHCSVFMAEVIDEAVSAGVEQPAIISGLYDSIIKNYLNRVKGNRSVGKVIFCQGMPFSADALATAVARQTGSQVVVPPNPGTVGALGIAMLAARELVCGGDAPSPSVAATPSPLKKAGALSHLPVGSGEEAPPPRALDLARFLNAKVEQKDTFVCGSNRGCGGAGNHCRIERLRTLVNSQRSNFTWGGGCSLHDKGTRKKKLPDLAPDPFREREELVQKLIAPFLERRSLNRHGANEAPEHADLEIGVPVKPCVAISDEFMLKGLFPFFAVFFHRAGFDLEILNGAGPDLLKRGIQLANAPFCAPMQLYYGVGEKLSRSRADWLFVPMLRSTPLAAGQRCSAVCPVAQGAPKLLASVLRCQEGRGWNMEDGGWLSRFSIVHHPSSIIAEAPRLLSPVMDCAEGNLESPEFLASCEQLAKELKLNDAQWREAWRAGVEIQRQFDADCRGIGRRALEFCRAQNIVPVVVLGRAYTIYNKVLNSNVPAILREQGAIGIPLDCYPLDAETPVFADMYWGYGQCILRAAHQVRRASGVYALYCSNYSCGPDSFNLHFAAYIMEGKPFAIIETDGHSGDAGTRTRVEAFLHCVEEDRRGPKREMVLNDFQSAQFSGLQLRDLHKNNGASERLLVPYIGPASEAVARVFRGLGLAAEGLPAPDAESLRLGRRYTSGKECLPMPLTLGSLLQRLARAKDGERFAYLMPSTNGPCRFGVYNLLNNIVLERLGWRGRVRVWSPKDSGYFDNMPAGTEMLIFTGIAASDFLFQAKLDTRPVERTAGGAEDIYHRYRDELLSRLESAARGNLSLGPALWQVAGGNLFGVSELLKNAGAEFAAMRGPGELPLVELAGEIYVRAVEFSNDWLIEKLESRGLRVHLAPKTEWINYCGHLQQQDSSRNRLTDNFSALVKRRIESAAFAAIGPQLGWTPAPSTAEVLSAAEPYVSDALHGEAVLTVGAPLLEWQHRKIDAVVNVGPLECMPSKIAQAQLHHAAEREGLLSLTLPLNGDPVSEAALDNFAFEVHARFQRRTNSARHTAHELATDGN